MRWIQVCCLVASTTSFAFGTLEEPKSYTQADYEGLRGPSSKLEITELAWNDERTKNLVDAFFKSYARLFVEFPRAFDPFDMKREPTFEEFWEQVCSNRLKNLCEDRQFKSHASQIFKHTHPESINFHRSRSEKEIPSNELFYSTWERINSAVERLKILYSEFQTTYMQELERVLSQQENFESLETFNAALDRVQSASETKSQRYTQDYLSLVGFYPERLLLTKTFLELIEGQYFRVERTDIIQAIKDASKTLEESFLFDLISTLASHEDVQNKVEGWNESFKILGSRSFDLKVYKTWSESFLEERPSFPSGSQIEIPKVKSEKLFTLIREFHNGDAVTADFLLHNSYQRASWRLRDLEQAQLANKLERIIEQELLAPEKMVQIKKLGGGAGTTYVASFEDRLRCVYKPSQLNLDNLIDFFITNSKNEVAASIIDRLIDLRMVPLTVEKTLGGFPAGSCQYFAENTVRASEMMQYDGKKPGKFHTPSGRSTKSSDILFFDWLIANRDRNIHNYILNYDGRVTLIDHGFTFKNLVPYPLRWQHLKNMLPSERIYKRLLILDRDKRILRSALKRWLSENDLWILRKKIRAVVKLIKYYKPYTSNTPLKQN